MLKFSGTFIKFMYAFLFQEEYFPNPLNKYEWYNKIGADLMPKINRIANEFTGFKHTD